MKLLVGLGNPGSEYAGNRHNVGFMAVDQIAAAYDVTSWRRRFQGLSAEVRIGPDRAVLLKPQTYMNDSGQSVGEAARFLKIDEADVIVLYDEIDLEPGKLKVKIGGGNAGHNGLRSISAHLGNDYGRVRIGVGHPGRKELVAGYVLHDFSKADHDWLAPMLDAMAKAAGRLTAGDLPRFTADVALALGTTAPSDSPVQPAKTSQPKSARTAGRAVRGAPSASGGGNNRHPAGDRAAKRQSALADNLKKWLAGRDTSGNGDQ